MSLPVLAVTKYLTPPGGWGALYQEFTRPAHATQRYQFAGQRGERAQVEVVALVADAAAGLAFIQAAQAAQGQVLTVAGDLNARDFAAFLHRVVVKEDRAIGCSDASLTWEVRLVLDVQTTAAW